MAGHSKWANIKHRKAAQDVKKGKMFTKLIRELTVAAQIGGADINSNHRLRAAVDKSLSENMTRDTIDRAVKRGAGELAGQELSEMTYEGYGPGGIAILVEAITNNTNRTVASVRHAFSKAGGNLGATGSVSYLFNKRGVIAYEPQASEEKIMEVALAVGAEDIIVNAKSIDVLTTQATFMTVKDALAAAGLTAIHAEVILIPTTKITLDNDTACKLLKLTDMIETLEDVQAVYHNADIVSATTETVKP